MFLVPTTLMRCLKPYRSGRYAWWLREREVNVYLLRCLTHRGSRDLAFCAIAFQSFHESSGHRTLETQRVQEYTNFTLCVYIDIFAMQEIPKTFNDRALLIVTRSKGLYEHGGERKKFVRVHEILNMNFLESVKRVQRVNKLENVHLFERFR